MKRIFSVVVILFSLLISVTVFGLTAECKSRLEPYLQKEHLSLSDLKNPKKAAAFKKKYFNQAEWTALSSVCSPGKSYSQDFDCVSDCRCSNCECPGKDPNISTCDCSPDCYNLNKVCFWKCSCGC